MYISVVWTCANIQHTKVCTVLNVCQPGTYTCQYYLHIYRYGDLVCVMCGVLAIWYMCWYLVCVLALEG